MKRFIEAGNTVVGSPKKVDKKSKITFKGSGHTLVLGSNVKILSADLSFSAGGGGYIELCDDTVLRGKIFVQDFGSKVVLGKKSRFQGISRLHAAEGRKILIGENCLFADIRIRTSDMHSIIDTSTGLRTNPAADVIIENHVWLAEDVRVYKGVTIGTGSIVGARSTVTSDVPPHTLALGTPAKPRKQGITWDVRRL